MLSGTVSAKEAGWVSRISGLLSAKSLDGKLRVLSLKSRVYAGDIISTEKDSFARIRLTDGGRLVLRPESTVTIETYHFDKDNPKKDNAVINLLKGGLRTVTGAIGKRGNKEAYQTKTPMSTIGIRGTVYGVLLCNPTSCGGLPAAQRPGTDGMYVNVLKGTIEVKNTAGSKLLSAGQFGHLATANSPLKILKNPPKDLSIKTPKDFQRKGPKTPEATAKEAMECKI
jgi:hypothetical protein